jgi:uncharacterized membrane protein YadS
MEGIIAQLKGKVQREIAAQVAAVVVVAAWVAATAQMTLRDIGAMLTSAASSVCGHSAKLSAWLLT